MIYCIIRAKEMRIMKANKIPILIVSILILSLLIGGCAAKGHESMDVAPQENSTASPPRDMAYDEYYGEDSVVDKAEEGGYGIVEPEKIITTVSISMQTKE